MISELGKCWTAVIFLGSYNFLLTIIGFNYKIKWDKWKIKIERDDHNAQHRIKELEKKNGHEQRQIDTLNNTVNSQNEKIKILEGVIEKLTGNRPNYYKDTQEAPKTGTIPTPPPPPPGGPKRSEYSEQKKGTEQQKPQQNDHNKALKEALEKRRKKLEGEDDEK